MVATSGKMPRRTLTAEETRLCKAALSDRHKRRLRRDDERQSAAEPKHGAEGRALKKQSRKRAMKLTTTAMEIAESRGPHIEPAAPKETEATASTDEAKEVIPVAENEEDSVEPEVEEVVADVVMAVASTVASSALLTPVRDAQGAVETLRPPRTNKQAPVTQRSPKRRRRVLQDSPEREAQAEGTISDTTDTGAASAAPHLPVACVVDGDPNIMAAGARECTGLGSEEESGPDSDDDDADSEWEGDWELGELSDEELADCVGTELPDTFCKSVAMNAARLAEMKHSGWEYGKLC